MVGGVAEALAVLAEGVLPAVVDCYEDASFVSHFALALALGAMLVVAARHVSCRWHYLVELPLVNGVYRFIQLRK